MDLIGMNGISEDLNAMNGNRDDYELLRRVGRGRYGEVFEAINITNNKRVAIKVLKAVRKDKIEREIRILLTISGGPNIIKLCDVLLDAYGLPSLVFKLFSEFTLKDVILELNDYEIRLYLHKLLKALQFVHNIVSHIRQKLHNSFI